MRRLVLAEQYDFCEALYIPQRDIDMHVIIYYNLRTATHNTEREGRQ